MPKFRKIDPKIWNDAKFRSLSDDGKLVFLFLLTHPHMTCLGAMRANTQGLAVELGWSHKKLTKAFREALTKALIEYEEKPSCMAIPNFLKYNAPESPNVVKAWASAVDLIPECELKTIVLQRVKVYTEGLTEGFRKALPEGFAKASLYQEPEQEPDITNPPTPLSKGGSKKKPISQVRTEQATEILDHFNRLKNVHRVLNSDTAIYGDCIRVISERLKDGYAAEQLKSHAEKFAGKVTAHDWYVQQNGGDEPPLNTLCWCPNVDWTPDELFGPKRLKRYFVKWRDQPVLTRRFLQEQEFKRLESQY